MQTSVSQASVLTIIVSTVLILLFGCLVIYYLFLYQKKRYRHEQELLQMQDTFSRTLMQSKLEIQEETLDHIAKELHANFSHLVSLININLSEILPQSSEQMRAGILETKSLAKQLMSELKALSASLNTDYIMHIGLHGALDNELSRMSKAKKIQVTFAKSGEEFRLRAEQEIILFRLCQELISNIIKYSGATLVNTHIDYSQGDFKLEISDNGIGFDVESATGEVGKKSTGLVNIRKRAKLINATFTITSIPGNGTSAQIIVPRPS